jgi:hypothetical protein
LQRELEKEEEGEKEWKEFSLTVVNNNNLHMIYSV